MEVRRTEKLKSTEKKGLKGIFTDKKQSKREESLSPNVTTTQQTIHARHRHDVLQELVTFSVSDLGQRLGFHNAQLIHLNSLNILAEQHQCYHDHSFIRNTLLYRSLNFTAISNIRTNFLKFI